MVSLLLAPEVILSMTAHTQWLLTSNRVLESYDL